MKTTLLMIVASFFCLLTCSTAYGQSCGHSITYTSSTPWNSGDGSITTVNYGTRHNDFPRLHSILTTCTGKIVFDEKEYFVDGTLPILSARVLEGTGSNKVVSFLTSTIVQAADAPIFKIGPLANDIAVRDLALIGDRPVRNEESHIDINTNTVGILAESGTTLTCNPPTNIDNCSSIGAQFSNLSFTGLNKGIYVNARNGGEWQFDNVRLDHLRFSNCIIGLHVNSNNAGLNIDSFDFHSPSGAEQGDSASTVGKTYGIFLERSTYTTISLLIGNGPTSEGPYLATALVYVKGHGNLTIQGAVAEGFRDDIIVQSPSRNYPITLIGNTFTNGVRVKDASIYSAGNQYSAMNNHGADTVASGSSQIYSIGDKWCTEGDYANCDEARGFTLQDAARNIFISTQNGSRSQVPLSINKDIFVSSDPIINLFTSAPALSLVSPTTSAGPILRIGRGSYWYDVTRNEGGGFDAGYLEFQANQAGYGGYSFRTQGGIVTVNYNGSVTFGTTTFAGLSPTAGNGTMIYCADCQQTSGCTSGGSGAMAKRIASSWQCN